jgi:hypothetical protein
MLGEWTFEMKAPEETTDPLPDTAPADSRGDFFFDELMTPQPDATGAYFRERLRRIEAERRAEAKPKG